MTLKAALIKYLHQEALSTSKQTLIKAIEKKFSTWTGFTSRAVQKYIPDSAPETDKGHIKRQKQGIRSTKEKIKTVLESTETDRDLQPPINTVKENHIFAYHAALNPKDSTIYINS